MVCHQHFEMFRTLDRAAVPCEHEPKVYTFNGYHCCRPCGALNREKCDRVHAEYEAACNACVDCQSARQAKRDKTQAEDTIDPSQPYGQHITLTCTEHPALRWHTKNIGWIGARSIFYSTHEDAVECSCPSSKLTVLKMAVV